MSFGEKREKAREKRNRAYIIVLIIMFFLFGLISVVSLLHGVGVSLDEFLDIFINMDMTTFLIILACISMCVGGYVCINYCILFHKPSKSYSDEEMRKFCKEQGLPEWSGAGGVDMGVGICERGGKTNG